MDPQMLVDPASSVALPAPYWFIQFFKVVGFLLHIVPMNLWFAGLIVAMFARTAGGKHAVEFSRRLMRQMPIIVAYGVNFGIVPLLFIQLAYFQFFYPATILMAWFWLAIVAMLIPAYYGIYFYASSLRDDDLAALTPWRRLTGWVSAVLFIAIGYLFVNGMSLLGNVEVWPLVAEKQLVGGAVLGTGLNMYDVQIVPRLLIMFGLALGTTAAWTVLDAAWFTRQASEAYQRWAGRFALTLATAGTVLFAAAGSWYVFGVWNNQVYNTMFAWPTIVLTFATAVAPGATVALLVLLVMRGHLTRPQAAAIAAAQIVALALNAVSRQVVQNIHVGAFSDLAHRPAEVEWSPLILFLILFVLGAALIFWMIAQIIKAAKGAT